MLTQRTVPCYTRFPETGIIIVTYYVYVMFINNKTIFDSKRTIYKSRYKTNRKINYY